MPKMRKPTFEEYVELGNEMKELNMKYIEIYIKFSKIFGKTIMEGMRIGEYHFGKTRSKLDDKLFIDYPEKSTQELANVFYGKLK